MDREIIFAKSLFENPKFILKCNLPYTSNIVVIVGPSTPVKSAKHGIAFHRKKGFGELRSTCNKLIEEMSRRLLQQPRKNSSVMRNTYYLPDKIALTQNCFAYSYLSKPYISFLRPSRLKRNKHQTCLTQSMA